MKTSKYMHSISITASLVAVLALTGCMTTKIPYMRTEVAQRIAAPAWMVQRDIEAGSFTLRAYERVHKRHEVANLYIEGDGGIYNAPITWSINPTPENPVALHLASKDNAENLLYLARPCQFTGTEECDEAHWKEGRFSEEVIASYNAALNEMSKRYDIKGFNLIGYSGGGGIATILAATRNDVVSLRTISGVLDHDVLTNINNDSPLSTSLNPVDYAEQLTKMPQYHFIGGQDEFIKPAILHSYLQSMPPSTCVQTMMVQEASYNEGWVNKWIKHFQRHLQF